MAKLVPIDDESAMTQYAATRMWWLHELRQIRARKRNGVHHTTHEKHAAQRKLAALRMSHVNR